MIPTDEQAILDELEAEKRGLSGKEKRRRRRAKERASRKVVKQPLPIKVVFETLRKHRQQNPDYRNVVIDGKLQ